MGRQMQEELTHFSPSISLAHLSFSAEVKKKAYHPDVFAQHWGLSCQSQSVFMTLEAIKPVNCENYKGT